MLGAFIGSFLNVCIWRMPREESIVFPASRCPACKAPIAWHDNIPVVSFLALGGRCRACRKPISLRYPLVEAFTAAMFGAVVWRFGVSAVSVIYLVFVSGLIVSSVIDLDFQIIPDEISLGGLALGLIISPFVPALHHTDLALIAMERSFLGAVVGGGTLYATGALGNVMLYAFRRLGVALRRHPRWRARFARYRHMRDSMGGGDIKLLAMAGSLLGWKLVLLTFMLAPVLALLPGLVVLITKRSHVIPYGPFLSLGLLVSLFYGDAIIAASGIEETVRLLRAGPM